MEESQTNQELTKFIQSFTVLKIDILRNKKILLIELNRPKQLNALNETTFEELFKLFTNIEMIMKHEDIRVIILTGNGKSFSAGLDLKSKIAQGIFEGNANTEIDVGRKAYFIYNMVRKLQDSLTAIENSPLPIIAAIKGYCLGGSISIINCADIRIATNDSKYSIKEIDIGLTTDLGALQRLVKQTGREGLIKKYSYTGETFTANDALKCGIIEEIVSNEEELTKRSFELADMITCKSPLVLWGIKRTINFARDNNIRSSLDMVATLNSALIQSEDISETIKGFLSKSKVMYPKL